MDYQCVYCGVALKKDINEKAECRIAYIHPKTESNCLGFENEQFGISEEAYQKMVEGTFGRQSTVSFDR